jgi:hypothetical protein
MVGRFGTFTPIMNQLVAYAATSICAKPPGLPLGKRTPAVKKPCHQNFLSPSYDPASQPVEINVVDMERPKVRKPRIARVPTHPPTNLQKRSIPMTIAIPTMMFVSFSLTFGTMMWQRKTERLATPGLEVTAHTSGRQLSLILEVVGQGNSVLHLDLPPNARRELSADSGFEMQSNDRVIVRSEPFQDLVTQVP